MLCLGYNWVIRSIDSFPHSFPRLVAIIYRGLVVHPDSSAQVWGTH